MTKKEYEQMQQSERKIICTPGFIAKSLDAAKISPTHEALVENANFVGDYPKNVDFSKAAKMAISGCRAKETERTK